MIVCRNCNQEYSDSTDDTKDVNSCPKCEVDEVTINNMRDVLKVQGYDGNWNYDEYMFGLYNGMELMLSIAEGREPIYKTRPEEWVKDRPVTHLKVSSH